MQNSIHLSVILGTISLVSSNVFAQDLDDVLKALDSFEESIESFTVTNELSFNLDLYGPSGKRAGQQDPPTTTTGLQSSSQSEWFFMRDEKWRVEVESSERMLFKTGKPKVGTSRLISVFDGELGKGKYVYVGSPTLGEEKPSDRLVLHNLMYRPTEFLYNYRDESISQLLHEAEGVREETFNGQKVLVAKTEIEILQGNYQRYHEIWFDPSRAVVVRRQTYLRRGKDKPWGLHKRRDTVAFVQDASSGSWLPAEAKTFMWLITDKGQGNLSATCHYRFRDWEVNIQLPKSIFSLNEPLVPPED